MNQYAKPKGIIAPDGGEVSTKPAFPMTIDLRWGGSDDELCRMTFYLDGSVRGDPGKLRTFLEKATTDVNPGVLLQWWMIAGMLQPPSPSQSMPDVSVGAGDPDAPAFAEPLDEDPKH